MSDGTIGRPRYAPTALDPAAGWPGDPSERRAFIAGLGATATLTFAAPTLVHAAEPLPMVGVIIPGKPPRDMLDEFRAGLRDLGYVEGRNIKLVVRWDHNDPGRYRQIAAEFARLPLRVVYVPLWISFVRAMQAVGAKKIPPVVGLFRSALARKLVPSLGRHGSGVTGVATTPPGIYAKRLQLLKEGAPGVSRVAALTHTIRGYESLTKVFIDHVETAAKSLGIEILQREVGKPADIGPAVAEAARAGANGLITTQGPFFRIYRRKLADAAAAHGLPSITGETGYAAAGGLMDYGASVPGVSRDCAPLVDKILKGAKPADLPMEQPSKINFVVNRKTAKALGLKLPRSILLRATEVIE